MGDESNGYDLIMEISLAMEKKWEIVEIYNRPETIWMQTTAILDENFRYFLGFEWLEFRFLSIWYLWKWWNLQQLGWILSFGKSSTLVEANSMRTYLFFIITGVRDNWMFTTLSFSPAFVELVVLVQWKGHTCCPTRLDSWDLPFQWPCCAGKFEFPAGWSRENGPNIPHGRL